MGVPVAVGYWDDPTRVIWVWVGTHRRLQGYDTYWVAGNRYGVCNDAENMGAMYDGAQAYAWEWDGADERPVVPAPATPPAGATVWRGYMLSDDDARRIGVI